MREISLVDCHLRHWYEYEYDEKIPNIISKYFCEGGGGGTEPPYIVIAAGPTDVLGEYKRIIKPEATEIPLEFDYPNELDSVRLSVFFWRVCGRDVDILFRILTILAEMDCWVLREE